MGRIVDGHRRPGAEPRDLGAARARRAHDAARAGNVPALELAERLVDYRPARLGKVFYSSSGAEAAEIALKMAVGYWRRAGPAGKARARQHSATATTGTRSARMGVGGIELFHGEFGPLLFPPRRRVSRPVPLRRQRGGVRVRVPGGARAGAVRPQGGRDSRALSSSRSCRRAGGHGHDAARIPHASSLDSAGSTRFSCSPTRSRSASAGRGRCSPASTRASLRT